MAFFRKIQKKINGMWYPGSITVGKPVTTDQVAKRLSQMSTVSPADTYAVLKDLGVVLSDYMAQGRSVKMEGIGTFYYTAAANGNGVATPEEVTASLINDVRVRFIPETRRTASGKVSTRSLVLDEIPWNEWNGVVSELQEGEEEDGGGGDIIDPDA